MPPHRSNTTSTTHMHLACLLAALLFVLYFSNFRHGSGVDTIPNTALPISILKEGNLELSEFKDMLDNSANTWNAAFVFGAMQKREGEVISSYPIGAALMAVPFFAAAELTGNLTDWHHYRTTAKIAAATFTALSAALLFLSLLHLTHTKAAFTISLLYGAATSNWPIISQDLWQHGPGMLCLTAAIFCTLRLKDKPTALMAIAIALLLSMAVSCRILNAIPATLLGLYILNTHRNNKSLLAAFTLLSATSAAILIGFNYSTYGTITGGYEAIYQSQWHAWRELSTSGAYTTPMSYGLPSILFSPSKGLLIYSPYLLYAFAAIFVLKYKTNTLNIALLGWILLTLILLAKSTLWWGGTAFGARYLSEALIPLSLLLGSAWGTLLNRKVPLMVFSVLAMTSIGIQSIGAFRSPCGWAETPQFADLEPGRHWNWKDSQIERCLRNGLKEETAAWEIHHYESGNTDF